MMRYNRINRSIRQMGFTLIELMIAMTISLTVIFASVSLYSSIKSSIATSQDLAKAQESLRGSFYLLSRSVRQAASLQISGANDSNQELIVTYAAPPAGHIVYSCLGNSAVSGSQDTYSSNGQGLYCDDGSGAHLIALDIEQLRFNNITGNNDNGLIVTIKITGMPVSLLTQGLSFRLALRQKILLEIE